MLHWAADQTETHDDDDADVKWTRADRADKFQNVKEFSAQLHAAFVGLVDGEGFDLVLAVEGCCDMEAW